MTTKKMERQISYWLVGANNKSQAPAVAWDLQDADGKVLAQCSHALSGHTRDDCKAALEYVAAYAKREGVPLGRIRYDVDSTDFFADC